jgi:hypothetical protein
MEDKQYKYIYGLGKAALDIPESDIRYAMENTKSNAEAARFLKVSFTTYKKYARLYVDRDSGKTLYELHKNQFGVGIRKDVARASNGIYSIEKKRGVVPISKTAAASFKKDRFSMPR